MTRGLTSREKLEKQHAELKEAGDYTKAHYVNLVIREMDKQERERSIEREKKNSL